MKKLTKIISTFWGWVRACVTRCERCHYFGARTYRQNTHYVEDHLNIVTLCPCCKQENDEYWEERWSELRYG